MSPWESSRAVTELWVMAVRASCLCQPTAGVNVTVPTLTAVGQATSRAVVSIIVALVVSDALITLICTQLGI